MLDLKKVKIGTKLRLLNYDDGYYHGKPIGSIWTVIKEEENKHFDVENKEIYEFTMGVASNSLHSWEIVTSSLKDWLKER